mmetsp:Transcript_2086/g.7571  ORF Transcript_2086/g.7571 Transcript_2086/m.7571 type:complete len:204 (+) Transcript_2086:357-968(+)
MLVQREELLHLRVELIAADAAAAEALADLLELIRDLLNGIQHVTSCLRVLCKAVCHVCNEIPGLARDTCVRDHDVNARGSVPEPAVRSKSTRRSGCLGECDGATGGRDEVVDARGARAVHDLLHLERPVVGHLSPVVGAVSSGGDGLGQLAGPCVCRRVHWRHRCTRGLWFAVVDVGHRLEHGSRKTDVHGRRGAQARPEGNL